MAKRWTGLMVAASYLAWCAAAVAQPPASWNEGMMVPLQVPQNTPMGFWPCPEPVPAYVPMATVEEPCPQGPCFYVGFDYLLWYTRKQSLPPLLTSGAFSDPIPGALGQPNTRVLLAGIDNKDNLQSGGRLNLAFRLDETWTVDTSSFLLLVSVAAAW